MWQDSVWWPQPVVVIVPAGMHERMPLLNEITVDRSPKKVYIALVMQLLLSICFLMLMEFDDGSKQLFCQHYIILIFGFLFIFGLILDIFNCCADEIGVNIVPDNIVPTFLPIFPIITILNICLLSPCTTSMYPLKTLLLSIGITIILTILSFMKLDLRTKEESLNWSLVALILSFTIYSFTIGDLVVWYILLSLSCFLCFLFLIYCNQIILENSYTTGGGSIFAATMLYMCIINMFIFILRILGTSKVF